jgi:hypothetical protein
LLGANIMPGVGNASVPQTMAMTNNADDVVAARAGRNSSPTHGGDPCTSGSDTTLIR